MARIERKAVYTAPIKKRQMAMVGNKVKAQGHDEEKQNKDFWLSRTAAERLDTVNCLRAQVVKNKRWIRVLELNEAYDEPRTWLSRLC